jgi:predicted RNA polymerase sigma factor
VRAKRTLAAKRVRFELPARTEIPSRLASVLEVIYLVFNEGYSATAGQDWMRPALCAEAMRLGRTLAGLIAGEGEVHGLVALMELQASRVGARTGPAGEPILLTDQDRRRWDRLLIRHGLQALDRAVKAGGAPGPYEVQAEIAACHARAHSVQVTDWERIAALYVVLGHLTPSPVIELNRAVAVGMAYGPARGLDIADQLTAQPALAAYAQLPAVRGDLLAKLDRLDEARQEFERAAALTSNERERALFRARAAACTTREADTGLAGIPLTGTVLLGLDADQLGTAGAGRAKRRTTSHPVGPVRAGGSGQASRRARVPGCCWHGAPHGAAPLLWLPR